MLSSFSGPCAAAPSTQCCDRGALLQFIRRRRRFKESRCPLLSAWLPFSLPSCCFYGSKWCRSDKAFAAFIHPFFCVSSTSTGTQTTYFKRVFVLDKSRYLHIVQRNMFLQKPILPAGLLSVVLKLLPFVLPKMHPPTPFCQNSQFQLAREGLKFWK